MHLLNLIIAALAKWLNKSTLGKLLWNDSGGCFSKVKTSSKKFCLKAKRLHNSTWGKWHWNNTVQKKILYGVLLCLIKTYLVKRSLNCTWEMAFLNTSVRGIIPHICHFIYTDIWCGWNILHPKRVFQYATKQSKLVNTLCKLHNICKKYMKYFHVQSINVYTFVTNMRYACGMLLLEKEIFNDVLSSSSARTSLDSLTSSVKLGFLWRWPWL